MKTSLRLLFCPPLAFALLSVVVMVPSLSASPSPQTGTPSTPAAPPAQPNDKDMKRPEVSAGDVGYINCQNHPGNTPVLVRAGRPLEVVTFLPCGDRFTILLYGFFYTQIDTKDHKVGYVYSNLISRDHSATSAREPTSAQVPTPTPNVAVTNATVVQPRPATPIQPQPIPSQPAPAEAPAPKSSAPVTSASIVQSTPTTRTQPQPIPA